MLQRAASNAYSWWWASHIRTKQSKWLDTDLQEMEERVKSMLKIIEEDGDSFAKKAEMYFKKRPELVSIVEETYKAYRALAEKYDHISGELHKANHTIATAFPDQIHLDMQDSEDDNLPKAITSIGTNHVRRPSIEIPRISLTNTRKETPTFLKKSRLSRAASQNNKDKAQEEIDKLQKAILVLQTEKEYIKSSYESGVAKYWEIEKQINEMQEEVSSLQDEFSISVVIEDDEARGLMAVAALRSCEDSLFKLQEQQKLSMEEAKIGSERIKIAKEMIETDKVEFDQSEEVYKISNNIEEDEHSFESEPICGNSKISSDTSVVELAEKINELVAKVVSFELTASSQTAKLRSMQSDIDLLHSHIQSFEEEKKALTDDSSSLPDELKQAEEEPQRRQDQVKCERGEQSVKSRISTVENILDDNAEGEVISLQNENVRRDCQIKAANEIPDTMANVVFEESGGTHEPKALLKDLGCFDHSELQISSLRETNNIHQSKESEPEIELILDHSEAGSQLKEDSINCLSKIEEVQISSSLANDNFYPSNEPKVEFEKQEVEISSSQKDYHSKENENIQSNKESNLQSEDQEISLNWLQSLVNGLEGKEKIILAEYTVILRNYKDIKKKLSEVEKENQEYLQGITKQIRELKSANAMKDEEIYSLRRNLRSLQLKCNENADAHLQKPTSVLQNTQMSELLEVSDAISTDGLHTNSAIEEKFRREIDASLEENLEFWLRFSSSFQNIQNFQTTFEDLQAEIEKSKSPGSLPFEKTLRELKTELQVWLEQNILLRGELESKVSSLGSLQEEISGALEASLEADDVEFAPYQAAKLQGELLNIQLENNKVAEELKAGLDHVRMMQAEVEKTISILQGKIILSEVSESISTNHEEFKPASPKNRIPLRAFLFGTKPKKKSMFSRVNPALLKRTSRSS